MEDTIFPSLCKEMLKDYLALRGKKSVLLINSEKKKI